jgi:hypothetical protein
VRFSKADYSRSRSIYLIAAKTVLRVANVPEAELGPIDHDRDRPEFTPIGRVLTMTDFLV